MSKHRRTKFNRRSLPNGEDERPKVEVVPQCSLTSKGRKNGGFLCVFRSGAIDFELGGGRPCSTSEGPRSNLIALCREAQTLDQSSSCSPPPTLSRKRTLWLSDSCQAPARGCAPTRRPTDSVFRPSQPHPSPASPSPSELPRSPVPSLLLNAQASDSRSSRRASTRPGESLRVRSTRPSLKRSNAPLARGLCGGFGGWAFSRRGGQGGVDLGINTGEL